MNIDNGFIQSIKDKANIVDVIGDYVQLKHTGSSYKACCPFHKENTPSFNVNESKQIFKCFGCGVSGDVIKFVELIENVDFIEALNILSSKTGLAMPTYGNEKDSQRYKELGILKEINIVTARHFYSNLRDSSSAKAYLYSRGITVEMIRTFGIGYSNFDQNYILELTQKFGKDMVIKSGIVIEREGKLIPRFKNRLMFPIFNANNSIIGFGGRQLEDYGPKYLNSPETELFIKKDNLYGYNLAKKNVVDSTVFLVEGYLDVIKMHQFGFKNTLASLGTAFTKEQGLLIGKIVKNLTIIYDSDSAGLDAAKRALDIATDLGINTSVLILKEAKDPDEYLVKKGKEAFIIALSEAYDYVAFNIEYIRRKSFASKDKDTEKFVMASVAFLKMYADKKNASHILIEKAIIRLANYTGYSVSSIGKDVFGKYYSPKQFEKKQKTKSIEEKQSLKLHSEIEDLDSKEKRLLNSINLGYINISQISISDFVFKENRKIFFNLLSNNKIEDDLLSKFEPIKQEESNGFIKNIKNNKIDNLIESFKKIQADFLKKDTEEGLQGALIVGQFIIKLNTRKNK